MLTLKSFIPRRRWLRFSLGTFLLAVAVIAYGCKWVLDRVKLCAGQYDVVAGLSVRDDFRRIAPPTPGLGGGDGGDGTREVGVFGFSFVEPQGWEKKVADWLGLSYQIDVEYLGFAYSRVDLASDLEIARKMPKLTKFSLADLTITPDILASVKRISGLETLTFTNVNMTKDEAVSLKRELPHVHILLYKEVLPAIKDGVHISGTQTTIADLP
jgi:hypothetical protein